MSQPTILVLASGQGARFIASGGTGSKLRALLGGKPVLERTLDAVRASGLAWHLEDAGHDGMGDSIAAGVKATSDASGWLILPGDLPLIQPRTLQAVAAALSHYGAVIPHYRGQRGHPVGFAASCREALLMLKGPQGAAAVLRSQEAINAAGRLDEDDDPGIVTDIDTVQDLRNAEALLAARQTP
ncbi:NTP transferase domain-containing protein [Ramlibacter sp. WS9]|uniref:nucleotidyltransferase family protein n=1 Tax=Ramlibacter sp. WS9 TaxID=1882741 RepID=UPI001141CE45|nr:nucleotidyltransferase family protein [Ramlibacter sp. WS9]ROZ75368.1 nucleotidyltransferase family protein [Ramlibacter sp. WS9]